MPPTAIGPFRVERELGRGGMGEVYLARDTRLDRQVAIKALPAHLAQDPDRLARFQREAKVLASLNHPGIAAIYGLEEADGHQYLVLEYVDGETLAQRLTRGAIPVDESLSLARQMTEALEAAHEKGIVHRDLKPANLMLTQEGGVKVLDFGLARTEDFTRSGSGHHGLADSPTLTSPAPFAHSPTIPGVIMGTAGYMSPEQARGKPVDKRSDIFSFGCVLYEMLTGAQPFVGETVADAIGATLHKDLDLSHLPPGTPPTVRMLLARCVNKDRANRLHDIGDARIEIAQAISDPSGTALGLHSSGVLATPRSRGAIRALPWVIAGIMAVAGATSPWWLGATGLGPASRTHDAFVRPVVRFTIAPPDGYTLPAFSSDGTAFAVSPRGDRIVFRVLKDGKPHLCVRDIASGAARVLPGTEDATAPFFSPDGKSIGFVCRKRLMRMPSEGGPALTTCEVIQYASFAWMEDGSIVWGASDQGIWRVRADGGTPAPIVRAGPNSPAPEGGKPVLGYDVPLAIPGADYFLCGSWDGPTTESFNVMAVSLKDGSVRTLLRTATEPRLIAPDRLLFTRGTTVMTVAFDPVRGAVVGDPAVALEGVRTDQWQDSAYMGASIGGTFAYVPGGRFGGGKRLIRVDASGQATPVMDTTDSFSGAPVVSPDGKRVALTTLRSQPEMWVLDLERRTMSLVTSSGEQYSPTWTLDGSSLLAEYVAPDGTNSVAKWPASGGGQPELLPGTSTGKDAFFPMQELADRSGLLVQWLKGGALAKPDLAIYKYGEATLTPVRDRPASEVDGCLSPDGSLLAYVSDESGTPQVYLGPLAVQGRDIQVSTAGGGAPRFSHDGKQLYYVDSSENLMVAPIESGTEPPRAGAPALLLKLGAVNAQASWRGGLAVMPDGSFLLFERAPWENSPPEVHVILNWPVELAAGRSDS